MQDVSLLRECINLQRLHIGLAGGMITAAARDDTLKIYGAGVLEALRGVPGQLEFTVGTVRWCTQTSNWFYEFDHYSLQDIDAGVLAKLKAKPKEEVGRDREERGRE